MALNPQNLQPIKSKEKATRLGKKGGIASGVAKRKRKEMKEKMIIALDELDKKTGKDNETAMILRAIKEAKNGDMKAFNTVADRVYDKPKQAQDIALTGNFNAVINIGKPVFSD